jgi:hypothetical protein
MQLGGTELEESHSLKYEAFSPKILQGGQKAPI